MTLLSTKNIKIGLMSVGHSKQKDCRFQDTLYSMIEKTQFSGFMFMFPQVVQKHLLGEVG